MKILVCDDERSKGEKTRKAIAAGTDRETRLLAGDELAKHIASLFDRAATMVKPDSTTPSTQSEFESDEYDIAILDNNLSELHIRGARHTAESIAGYARAFGKIPYIVSLNKNPHVDFDLRHLVGDYQTHADLALNDKHLPITALWTGISVNDQFRPWYWPSLQDVAIRRRRQIAFVKKHLDDSILSALGLPKSAADRLSLHALGALYPEARSASRATFRKFFVASCRSLPIRRERELLARSITSKDDPVCDIVCRVVAGELDRWIRRDLFAPQDVLVDLPHLLMRMPFLLGAKARRLQAWNDVVAATEPPYGLSTALYRSHLRDARFREDAWVKSPCFWWTILKSDRELSSRFARNRQRWASAVFCEDLSRFKEYGADEDGPSEFAAEVEGTWARRHVEIVGSWSYTPKSRFAK